MAIQVVFGDCSSVIYDFYRIFIVTFSTHIF